jgi:hypothetical protein
LVGPQSVDKPAASVGTHLKLGGALDGEGAHRRRRGVGFRPLFFLGATSEAAKTSR